MPEEQKAPNLIWKPLPGSQELAITCPSNHILYHGTRGPGKTDCQLMAFRKHVGQGYGRFWRGIIFDREYKMLDQLVTSSNRWFPMFGDGAEWLRSAKDMKWVWPTGEELLFRSVRVADDYWDFHGQEFPFIGWNELTKYPTPDLYDSMMSINRSSFLPGEHSPDLKNPLPAIPLVIFSTTNPYGSGHNWVKKRFIDVAPSGQVVKTVTNAFDPLLQVRRDVVTTQVAIFGSYKENKYLPASYIAEMEKITNPNKRKAWLYGDWSVVAGGALDDLWDENVHVIPRFPIPNVEWRLDRSLDWGSTHPFSVGWWAEANGEEIPLPPHLCCINNRVISFDPKDESVLVKHSWCPPRGSILRVQEWYGAIYTSGGAVEGLRMSPTDAALGIVKIEKQLVERDWITRRPSAGPADNSIRNITDSDSDSTEKKMADQGIRWMDSDKKAGSRKIGLELLRERLTSALKFSRGEPNPGPAIFFMENCRHAISTLPVLPRDDKDPDDIDTESEDHIYDDIRYRCLAGNIRYATRLNVSLPR